MEKNQSHEAQLLMQARNELLRLHKTLVDSESALYDRDWARIRTAGQHLELLLHDPWFAWLRRISALVAEIDEAFDSEVGMTPAESQRFLERIRSLLKASETGTEFERRYYAALQRDPAVVLAHGRMVRLLKAA